MKWKTQEEVPDAFGPKAFAPAADQLGPDALRAVVLVGVGVDDLAERLGQHLDRGRELRHVDLRPRARRTTCRIPDNYGNPFGTNQQRAGHRHVGHDEPRHVQRPGRPAHPLA